MAIQDKRGRGRPPGSPNKPKVESVQETINNLEQAIQSDPETEQVIPAVGVEANSTLETDNFVALADDDKPAFFSDPEEIIETSGMLLNDPKKYADQGLSPAVEVTQHAAGFGAGETAEQFKSRTGEDSPSIKKMEKRTAKPATELDLEHLDESMIMDMPEIKAASFEIIDILNPKFKDKSLRGRWSNFKNAEASNLHRLLSLGFVVAHVDDIDQSKTKLPDNMIDGTQVKYYDVLLLKIPVLRLMSLYKSNIIRSISKLGRMNQKGVAEANRQFMSDINAAGEGKNYLDAKNRLGGRDPVEFFTP